MAIKPFVSGNRICFQDAELGVYGEMRYTPELWEKVEHLNWSVKFKKVKHRVQDEQGNMCVIEKKEPQYLVSGVLRKSLHQVVMEHYFGEAAVEDAYSKNMIIEHLDNNGLNCDISNLYFLLKVTNTYKGNSFDKNVKEYLPTAGLRMYHIFENKTFQITIVFNKPFTSESGEVLDRIKILYDQSYEIVFQDAVIILDDIHSKQCFDLAYLSSVCRWKDIRINYCPNIELTEEEKKLPPGRIIQRDGQLFLIPGKTEEDFHKFHRVSAHYDENWN